MVPYDAGDHFEQIFLLYFDAGGRSLLIGDLLENCWLATSNSCMILKGLRADIPRDGVVVRASALQSLDLGVHFPSRVISKKDLRKRVFTASLLAAQHIEVVWRTNRQARFLCPWARHLAGCLHLHVADWWRGQAIYALWWPSLTKDMQTMHDLTRMKKNLKSIKLTLCI